MGSSHSTGCCSSWNSRFVIVSLMLRKRLRYCVSEFLCYTYSLLHGDLYGSRGKQICEWLFWTVFFGPLLFPFSLIVWHLVNICQGEEKFHKFETIARSRVLSSLSVLTKSCMQLTLQVSSFWYLLILSNNLMGKLIFSSDVRWQLWCWPGTMRTTTSSTTPTNWPPLA